MRDDVCIALNEREPLKQQFAEELELQLEKRHLSCKRLEHFSCSPEIILERSPRIVVADYLLGDISTALDLLTSLKKRESATPTQVIVWTDEPSVNVAISAMKLGAYDYLELNVNSSVEKIVQTIESCLAFQDALTKQPKRVPNTENLVAQSKVYQATIAQADSISRKHPNVISILGEPGTGRSSLGRYIHRARPHSASLIEIDLDTWVEPTIQICGDRTNTRITPYLSHQATVILDHVQWDTGEVLEALVTQRNFIWPNGTESSAPMLIVGTSEPKIAQAWQRLLAAEILELPSLKDRQQDFWPLVQRFQLEAQHLGDTNKLKFSASIVEELQALVWPGNLTQLRAAVIDALTTPLTQLQEELKQGEKSSASKRDGAESTHKDDQLLLRAMIAAKSRWERYELQKPYVPDPLVARSALDRTLGNYRIAAAMLGTGVPQIRLAVSDNNKVLKEQGESLPN